MSRLCRVLCNHENSGRRIDINRSFVFGSVTSPLKIWYSHKLCFNLVEECGRITDGGSSTGSKRDNEKEREKSSGIQKNNCLMRKRKECDFDSGL